MFAHFTYWEPFFPALLVVSVAALIISRASSAWRRFSILCAIALFLFSWPPVAVTAVSLYEVRYPPALPADRTVEAIVVLSSSVYEGRTPASLTILGPGTYERCRYAAWLYENWKSVPVLASGGGSYADAHYAVAMGEELRRDGVPEKAIWIEDQSRSTYENAVNSAAILRKGGIHRVALVTEAFHMLRAERCFRKQGIEVVPAPCGFRGFRSNNPVEPFPGYEAISWNEDTMHETIGLLWYALTGKI